MVQLLTSSDPGICKAGDLQLVEKRVRQRLKFRPAASLVETIISQDHFWSRQALRRVTKAIITEEDDEERHKQLSQLPAQGEMVRVWNENSPELLVSAGPSARATQIIMHLVPPSTLSPLMPTCTHGGRRSSDTCPLCQQSRQSLPHVLNNCPAAMDLWRYSKRHDEVLQVLGDFIRAHIPPHFSISIDAPTALYCFLSHITPTSLQLDIVWWSEDLREL